MADMQAGIGPFLGAFLQQRGWSTGPIGTVMTVGGVAGMLMTAPAGAFGAVMTVQGVGASLSPAIGGWLAQLLGYHAAFYILGSFALASVALWIGFAGTLRPACSGTRGREAGSGSEPPR